MDKCPKCGSPRLTGEMSLLGGQTLIGFECGTCIIKETGETYYGPTERCKDRQIARLQDRVEKLEVLRTAINAAWGLICDLAGPIKEEPRLLAIIHTLAALESED